MSHHNTLPALLFLPGRLRQEPVLALDHKLPLLWSALVGSAVSRLLPSKVFAVTGGVEWKEPGTIQLAVALCDWIAFGVESVVGDSLPGQCFVELTGIHLEQEKSRDKAQLFGSLGVYGAISAMGLDGIQSCAAWHSTQGRNMWCHCWTQCVFLPLPGISLSFYR